jgi:hypothetical protein
VTAREIVSRLLLAALREEPGPFRVRLALAEWERIQAQLRQEMRREEPPEP